MEPYVIQMRVRLRKNIIKKTIAIILIMIIPISGGVGLSNYVNSIMRDLKSYSYNAIINTTVFIEPNKTYLDELANIMDYRYEMYHIPLNFTTSAIFTDYNYSKVSYYSGIYDSCLWTGTALLGQAYRYRVAKIENNTEEMHNASRVIRKLFTGLENMVVVPSGGYGKTHPGILARAAVPPENKSLYPYVFSNPDQWSNVYFNGTGPYSNWRYVSHTSRDMFGGWMMGIASIIPLMDELNLRNNITQLVEQLYEGFRLHNWLGIDGNNNPTGSDIRQSILNAGWRLGFLQLARAVDPQKYEKEYYYLVGRSGYWQFISQGGDDNLLLDYYAFNFNTDVLYTLISLENDDIMRTRYIKAYINGIYNPTRTHRNAYYNVMYLLFTKGLYILNDTIKDDILDQLMRFGINQVPYRCYKPDPVPSWYKIDKTMEKYKNMTEHNRILKDLIDLMGTEIDFNQQYYNQPLLANNFNGGEDFIWQRNPFHPRGYWENHLCEAPGIDYLTPYWLARYLSLI
ncbi:MAG: hypothetical protein ACTSU2_15825 [Promethearchaeota archaeon]